MTAPAIGVRSWAAEVDVDCVLAALRARFPRAMIWHGEFTGSLWAAWRDRSGAVRMVEARDPDELRRHLENAGIPHVLPPQAPATPGAAGMTAGLWSPPTPPRPCTTPPSRAPSPTVSQGRHEARRRRWLQRFLDKPT